MVHLLSARAYKLIVILRPVGGKKSFTTYAGSASDDFPLVHTDTITRTARVNQRSAGAKSDAIRWRLARTRVERLRIGTIFPVTTVTTPITHCRGPCHCQV